MLVFLGNLFHGLYLFWLERGNKTVSETIFRLKQDEKTEVVIFEKIKMRWIGITSIQHLRLEKTDTEIDEYVEIQNQKGVILWYRQVTPEQLDHYCQRFGNRLTWREEDMKMLFFCKARINPEDQQTTTAATNTL
jgi:hypothetical protein